MVRSVREGKGPAVKGQEGLLKWHHVVGILINFGPQGL